MAKLFANSGDPDQMPQNAASDLGLHCLPITLLLVCRLQLVKIFYTPTKHGMRMDRELYRDHYVPSCHILNIFFFFFHKYLSWKVYLKHTMHLLSQEQFIVQFPEFCPAFCMTYGPLFHLGIVPSRCITTNPWRIVLKLGTFKYYLTREL